jgi:transposase
MKVRVGREASGHARCFERRLAELNFEIWIGDAAEIRASGPARRRPIARMHSYLALAAGGSLSTDLDTELENRDLRQLLRHRHRLMQKQLQAVALNEGLRCKKRLCAIPLVPHGRAGDGAILRK